MNTNWNSVNNSWNNKAAAGTPLINAYYITTTVIASIATTTITTITHPDSSHGGHNLHAAGGARDVQGADVLWRERQNGESGRGYTERRSAWERLMYRARKKRRVRTKLRGKKARKDLYVNTILGALLSTWTRLVFLGSSMDCSRNKTILYDISLNLIFLNIKLRNAEGGERSGGRAFLQLTIDRGTITSSTHQF